jgi:hypothetical protein
MSVFHPFEPFGMRNLGQQLVPEITAAGCYADSRRSLQRCRDLQNQSRSFGFFVQRLAFSCKGAFFAQSPMGIGGPWQKRGESDERSDTRGFAFLPSISNLVRVAGLDS